MTAERLIEAIGQIPGINRTLTHRWTKHGEDRLYLVFSVSDPGAETFVDLRSGVMFGFMGKWEHDPRDLGERARLAVLALCKAFRTDRVREKKRRVGMPA